MYNASDSPETESLQPKTTPSVRQSHETGSFPGNRAYQNLGTIVLIGTAACAETLRPRESQPQSPDTAE